MEKYYNQSDSIFFEIVYLIHFYFSLIVGWGIFHTTVFPMAYFAKEYSSNLQAQLPVYVVNVLAFGCLVYLVTKPYAQLYAFVMQRISKAISQHFSK